jgi:hypothetical protein
MKFVTIIAATLLWAPLLTGHGLKIPESMFTAGVNLGAAFPDGDGGNTFQFGIEVSWFRLQLPFYYGAYLDTITRFGHDWYASLGGEIGCITGWFNPGIDAGRVFTIAGEQGGGWTLRGYFSIAWVPVLPYLRKIWYDDGQSVLETGLLLKLPFD